MSVSFALMVVTLCFATAGESTKASSHASCICVFALLWFLLFSSLGVAQRLTTLLALVEMRLFFNQRVNGIVVSCFIALCDI